MSDGVGMRSHQSLFFARKKNKADATSWTQPGSLDCSECIDHQSGIASVIESACTQFPRIEMRTEYYEFARLFAAAYLGNDVARSDRSANAVGNRQISTKLLPRSQQARDAVGVLARDQHCGNRTNLALQRIRVPIQQVMRTRGLKSDGQSLGLPGAKNNAGSPQVFGEQVIPFRHFVRVYEQQRS